MTWSTSCISISSASRAKGRSESDLGKEALAVCLGRRAKEDNPYLLGRDLFGRYGSGVGDLARDRERLLKAMFQAKNPR